VNEQQTGAREGRSTASPRRIAVIDVGSNSVKALVADVVDGTLREVDGSTEVTRVARGASARGTLDPAALAATRAAVAAGVELADRCGATRVLAAATGGLRLAPDPARAAAAIGAGLIELPVLAPEVEAHLSLLGVRAGAGWPAALGVIDLGGASTEISWLGPDGIRTTSVAAGAVTLTELFLTSDPPARQELDALDGWLAGQLPAASPRAAPPPASSLPAAPSPAAPPRAAPPPAAQPRAALPPAGAPSPPPLHAVGGTLTALACVAGGIPVRRVAETHGVVLRRDRIETVTAWLERTSSAALQSELGLAPGRADLLVAGAHLALALLDHLGSPELRVSSWGMRHGLALAAGQDVDPRRDPTLALALARRPAPRSPRRPESPRPRNHRKV
jgi:exopolyphosphatase/guanosine-5'-triphosphate,3'-diphosphate pyrophosphatase